MTAAEVKADGKLRRPTKRLETTANHSLDSGSLSDDGSSQNRVQEDIIVIASSPSADPLTSEPISEQKPATVRPVFDDAYALRSLQSNNFVAGDAIFKVLKILQPAQDEWHVLTFTLVPTTGERLGSRKYIPLQVNHRFIVMPFCNKAHWVVAVADRDRKIVTMHDPGGYDSTDEASRAILKFFDSLESLRPASEWTIAKDYTLYVPADGKSCGISCIIFCLRLMYGLPDRTYPSVELWRHLLVAAFSKGRKFYPGCVLSERRLSRPSGALADQEQALQASYDSSAAILDQCKVMQGLLSDIKTEGNSVFQRIEERHHIALRATMEATMQTLRAEGFANEYVSVVDMPKIQMASKMEFMDTLSTLEAMMKRCTDLAADAMRIARIQWSEFVDRAREIVERYDRKCGER